MATDRPVSAARQAQAKAPRRKTAAVKTGAVAPGRKPFAMASDSAKHERVARMLQSLRSETAELLADSQRLLARLS